MNPDNLTPPEDEFLAVDPRHIELIDQRPPSMRQTAPRPSSPPRFRGRRGLPLFLFIATCASTFLSGMSLTPGPDEQPPLWDLLRSGALYSVALMSILMAHEMGHYLQARRYRVPATLPYFIPFPLSPIGTMGAVIVQGAGVADRKSMFDIAISGPLAGLVLALPAAWFGLEHAQIVPKAVNSDGFHFGVPLIVQWMGQHLIGSIPAGYEIQLNPLLFAGWVGIFITALNLIPIGQLDGGHILYTLLGRRAHAVAVLLLLAAVGYMAYTGNYSYGLMVFLLLMMGPRHPPTADDSVPLGWFRIALGWLTLGFIFIGFTPTPIV